ncbi:MAG TPA: glycosyl hydrolase family 79 C-terminal domain-containing protein [Verrucomicrobiae bacterium]|nr:glycosyl hydrolase family 79 C-terminal domain-containing protein [Verrucomicrobiae bacterium]
MKTTQSIFILVCAGFLLAQTALAQSPVTVTIDTKAPGTAIPDDFAGLSFEMQYVLPNTNGTYFFSPKNRPLVAMFQTLGIKNLRVGGNTADRPGVAVPGPADADSLFAFARAAGVKVIYTLRLHQGRAENVVPIAKYIEQHYRAQLACFAIGNEPDVFTKEYSVYRDEWEKYVAAITAVAPEAKFCGPCATPTRVAWSRQFADDFAKSGLIKYITQHDYPGGDSRHATNVVVARDKMLSPAWLNHYEKFYYAFATTALSNGLPYRYDEANSFYDGGAKDVSDTFASALWGLDFLHWWAVHGCAGINFHTGDKVAARDMNNPCRYAAFWTSSRGYNVHPLGYGLKAFDLGEQGNVLPVTIANTNSLDLTAYAVRGEDKTLRVTIINKGHGADAQGADVTINATGTGGRGQVIFLSAPDGNLAAKSGVTLGGASIEDNGAWDGKWKPLKTGEANHCRVTVPPASAAVVKLTLE